MLWLGHNSTIVPTHKPITHTLICEVTRLACQLNGNIIVPFEPNHKPSEQCWHTVLVYAILWWRYKRLVWQLYACQRYSVIFSVHSAQRMIHPIPHMLYNYCIIISKTRQFLLEVCGRSRLRTLGPSDFMNKSLPSSLLTLSDCDCPIVISERSRRQSDRRRIERLENYIKQLLTNIREVRRLVGTLRHRKNEK